MALRFVGPATGVLLALVAGHAAAAPLIYDRTITITQAERPITFASQGLFGTDHFIFDFDDAPVPLDASIPMSLTFRGQADVDGISDVSGEGFQETVGISLDTIGLAIFGGSTKGGPFGGSRTFDITAAVGFGGLNLLDGLTARVLFAQGVGASQPDDFLSVRIVYTYDGVLPPDPPGVPLPAGGLLLIGAAGALLVLGRRHPA